jgi:predicted cupin superfamily sugar epimerase
VKNKIVILGLICFGLVAQASGGREMTSADDVIRVLDLKPLPDEGGYYRETYRSAKINAPGQIFGFNSPEPRVISTAIYFLVRPESFSALHRIKSDEVFHFYAGDSVEMIQIDESGNIAHVTIGSDIFNGETPQVVVRKGTWQALRLKSGGAWALMGTTVSPGFEFSDFELGEREKMIKMFPQLSDDIIKFSREPNQKAH